MNTTTTIYTIQTEVIHDILVSSPTTGVEEGGWVKGKTSPDFLTNLRSSHKFTLTSLARQSLTSNDMNHFDQN